MTRIDPTAPPPAQPNPDDLCFIGARGRTCLGPVGPRPAPAPADTAAAVMARALATNPASPRDAIRGYFFDHPDDAAKLPRKSADRRALLEEHFAPRDARMGEAVGALEEVVQHRAMRETRDKAAAAFHGAAARVYGPGGDREAARFERNPDFLAQQGLDFDGASPGRRRALLGQALREKAEFVETDPAFSPFTYPELARRTAKSWDVALPGLDVSGAATTLAEWAGHGFHAYEVVTEGAVGVALAGAMLPFEYAKAQHEHAEEALDRFAGLR